jgi:predicted DNA-binding protein (MmcQ/YjbR family)
MPRTIADAVRDLCLGLPEVEEVFSHGSPDFRVAGKTFAGFWINHHGDGHVALWLHAPPGAQQLYTEMEPEHYFVPPYVGPKGWLGVELNRGLGWDSVCLRVNEAWRHIAPAALSRSQPENREVAPPERAMTAEEIDPFLRADVQARLAELESQVGQLPETNSARQFGNPVWKAGKKTFVGSHFHEGRLCLQFWVGVDQQGLLTMDPRYRIPAYMGHNGWIELDIEDYADHEEIRGLLLQSYRHFALKRMLKALPEEMN